MKKGVAIFLIVLVVLIIIGVAYYLFVGKDSKKKVDTNLADDPNTPCIPYTQAQQDTDYLSCVGSCVIGSTITCTQRRTNCNNNRKPLKTC